MKETLKAYWKEIFRRNKTAHIEINPLKPTKNKWLYPTDNFGKMEKGVVYYSETYNRK